MAPTAATVPVEKKVEPMEETKKSMICVNGCTQSTDKLLEVNIEGVESGKSGNANNECPKGCTNACCSNKCCLQCATCNNDDEKNAVEHLALGKRNLLTGELNAATDSFAMAADMLRTRHGEMAIECCDAYTYYGKSLLQLSRMEANVLQNGLKDCPLEDEQMN